jgi:predicted DsbA family dithiol-disulfide isomerase
MTEPLRIDIWSDIACPWCYVGKRRLEAALSRFRAQHAEAQIELVWHSFQLDPSAPRTLPAEQCYAERLARKYGTTPAQGQAMVERMVQTAALDGIAMDFERIRPGNTFDAHRLLHWAHARGAQDALKERLLRAYLCEGQPIGEPEVLVRLAGDVGLDVDEAQGVVSGDAFAQEVRADLSAARQLGISGVPFFVFARRYGVSGAQAPDTLVEVLERAWAEREPAQNAADRSASSAGPAAEGEVCGPDGCNPPAS